MSCALGDCLISTPKGCLQPRELWFSNRQSIHVHVSCHLHPIHVHCTNRGGIQAILGKSELQKVMERRRPDAHGNIGRIRAEKNGAHSTTIEGELAEQLAKRSHLVENVRH